MLSTALPGGSAIAQVAKTEEIYMRPATSMIWLIGVLFVTAVSSEGWAGVIVEGSSYAAYDAAMADIDAIDAVGKVVWSGGYASGVYLRDNWVLTAAHVAAGSSNFSFVINGAAYTSSEVHVYGGWTGNVSLGGDLALIKLAEDEVTAQTSLIYSGTTANLLDEVFYLSGYGKTGTGGSGATGAGGVLHAGENLVEKAGGSVPFFNAYHSSILFYDFDDPTAPNDGYPWSANSAEPYEYMVASGDSGGGGFVLEGSEFVLAGINSFIVSADGEPDSDYGDIGALICLAEYRDWMMEITGEDFTAVPEPVTLGFLMLGAMVFSFGSRNSILRQRRST